MKLQHLVLILSFSSFLFSFHSQEQLKQDTVSQAIRFYENKEYDEAVRLFNQILKDDLKNLKVRFYYGHVLKEQRKFAEAGFQYLCAIEIDPKFTDAYIELTNLYHEAQLFSKALELLEEGLRSNPDDVRLLFYRANTLSAMNRNQEAYEAYKYLITKLPFSSSVFFNQAYTLKKMGRVEEALEHYNRAAELNPMSDEIKFSRGLAYLISGDFEKGWQGYEHRWSTERNFPPRIFDQPLWDGEMDLNGKIFFLHAEQGFGDTFMFARYAQELKKRGAYVIVAVQPPLVSIISLCPYVDKVISLRDKVPPFDVHAPMASMPYFCKTRLETVPAEIPYLFADEKLVAEWAEKLSSDKKIKVGIVFNGNSNYSTAMLRAVVAFKSAPLAAFKALAENPEVTLYCLQKETGMKQLDEGLYDFKLVIFDEDFDKTHGRFMDTAAVIKNLDLVITVDTGTAHLAAGLGTEVWVLLPEPADWRWLLDRNDTPWYPNMRLFRQSEVGNWTELFDRVSKELDLFVSNKKMKKAEQLQMSTHSIQDKRLRIEGEILRIIKRIQEMGDDFNLSNSYGLIEELALLSEFHAALVKRESVVHKFL